MKYELNVTENILDVREMTAEEIKADEANRSKASAELSLQETEAKAKADAKAELLARLGITEEEAALLLA